jgi:AP-2 complex subunit alpha
MSSTSQSFVKKKAALTLLRLYRKHPEVFPAAEWALRIVSIMDDKDLVMSILPDQTSSEKKNSRRV